VNCAASNKDAQSKTMLIAHYALRPSTGSASNPGTALRGNPETNTLVDVTEHLADR
jgi:hypothetical protein